MRILVCGSRGMPSELKPLMIEAIKNLPIPPTVIVSGAARGADSLAREVALELGFQLEEYPADWQAYGKKAGFIRNQQMLDTGVGLVLAFHPSSGCTPGTQDMIRRAANAGVPVKVVTYGA